MPMYLLYRGAREEKLVWRFGLRRGAPSSHAAEVWRDGAGEWHWRWSWTNDLVQQESQSRMGHETKGDACLELAEFLEGDPNVDWWNWALRLDDTQSLDADES